MIHQKLSVLALPLLILAGCVSPQLEEPPYVKRPEPNPAPTLEKNFFEVESDESYKKIKSTLASKPLVEYYQASWCRYCTEMGPIIKELSDENKSVVFLKINFDRCPEAAKVNNVTSLPTVRVGSKKIVGLTPKVKIQDSINEFD